VKIGLLDYIIGTLNDPAFDRDIWLVPVGINYDRVLEDRSLIRERIVGGHRPSRLTQLGNVLSYLGWNTVRLFTGQLKRYGRVAIAFGTPISVRGWLASQPAGILALPKEERLPHVQRLAEQALERIGAVIPVTPVPLAAAALLSFGSSVVSRSRLLDRLDEVRDRLGEFNARIVRTELPVSEVWDRAWLMFSMRRLVVAHGDDLVILPSARPLLEYYANSIRHLLPAEMVVAYSPASETDATLPRLATRSEMDIMTKEVPVLKKRG
jgi:glycerol-3-phosphate O-acyltransferase